MAPQLVYATRTFITTFTAAATCPYPGPDEPVSQLPTLFLYGPFRL